MDKQGQRDLAAAEGVQGRPRAMKEGRWREAAVLLLCAAVACGRG